MERHKVLILGNHPLVADLQRQYLGMGHDITLHADGIVDASELNEATEVAVLMGDDYAALTMLKGLAEMTDMSLRGDKRLICHLLLHSQIALRMVQSCDFSDEIRERMDVYPFTMDEVWSRTIKLDYKPITINSEQTAHLVIFGTSDMAEAVAFNAAMVGHFPNYVRDHSLRTRITLVCEDATRLCQNFTARYRYLFDNCYYRLVGAQVNDSTKLAVTDFHEPQYKGKREDFVDVEWEFVEANIYNTSLRNKLQMWADSDKQLLTLVFAHDDCDRNMTEAMYLLDEVYDTVVPIYAYKRSDALEQIISPKGRAKRVTAFGMRHCGYDVSLPLVRMAKTVNYIYDQCYNDNDKNWNGILRYAVEIDADKRETLWQKLGEVKRMSSIYNAMNVAVKMRSVGLPEEEWDRFYDIPQQDIELLAEVEHNRWSVEELLQGYRPCTDEEQQMVEKDIDKKEELKQLRIHYDLRAYNDLRQDKTGKSAKIYDLCLCSCLPLIAKSFTDEKGGAS